MPETTTITFTGPLPEAYALVDDLRADGVEVEWVPPPEERTSAVETIAIAIAARGSYDLVLAAIRRARERLQNRGEVTAEEPAAGD